MAIVTNNHNKRELNDVLRAAAAYSVRDALEEHLKKHSQPNFLPPNMNITVLSAYPLTLWYNYEHQAIVSEFTHGECYLPVRITLSHFSSYEIRQSLTHVARYLQRDHDNEVIYNLGLDDVAHEVEEVLPQRFEERFADYEAFMLTNPSFDSVAYQFKVPNLSQGTPSVNVDVCEFDPYDVGAYYTRHYKKLIIKHSFDNVHPRIMDALSIYLQSVDFDQFEHPYFEIERWFDLLDEDGRLRDDEQWIALYQAFIKNALSQTEPHSNVTLIIRQRLERDVEPFKTALLDWTDEAIENIPDPVIRAYVMYTVLE